MARLGGNRLIDFVEDVAGPGVQELYGLASRKGPRGSQLEEGNPFDGRTQNRNPLVDRSVTAFGMTVAGNVEPAGDELLVFAISFVGPQSDEPSPD